MAVTVADGYTQLALHVLAHVPQGGPGELYDARYVAWSTQALGDHGLAADGAVIGARWRGDPGLAALHGLPELFGSLAALRRCAARPLASLRADEVASPALLAALQGQDEVTVELVFAALGLAAPGFTAELRATILPAMEEAREAVADAVDALLPAFPALAEARVELAWALGRRGRALPRRLLVGVGVGVGVGAPAAWSDGDAATSAVLAAHEHAVRACAARSYAIAEWRALVEVAGRITRCPADLRDAHARWLADLDLSGVLAGALAAGLTTPAEIAALTAPGDRAAILAGLSRRAG
ncbi:MAG: hypothetical protein R3A79_08055 [Nannocystaceae bacterium]